MSHTQRVGRAGRCARLGALAAVGLLFAFGQAKEARAQWEQPSGSSNIHNTNAGNVGVGTASPTYRLHVAGDNTQAGGYPVIKLENRQAGGNSWWFYSGAFGVPGALGIYDQAAGSYRMFFDPAGGLGVGTTSPLAGAKVEVRGGAAALPSDFGAAGLVSRRAYDPWTNQGATSTGILGASSASYNYQTANGVYGYANPGGFAYYTAIGVKGVAEATQDSQQTGTLAGGSFLGKGYAAAGAGPYNTKALYGVTGRGETIGTTSNVYNSTYGGHFTAVNSTGQANTAIAVYAEATGAGANYGVYSAAGKNFFGGSVGVGTNDPQKALHVVGDIKATGDLVVDGNISAKFQDLAEWVPTAQRLAAGTVVILDPARANHVLASAGAYDTAVAGVVSEQPGIVLGEGGEGKVKVATTGRVKVKVDATKAPIKIGDLLVTSDVIGVAMKSEPITVGGRRLHAPGTIIGKALEPLEKGAGEILVLLSMQ